MDEYTPLNWLGKGRLGKGSKSCIKSQAGPLSCLTLPVKLIGPTDWTTRVTA